MADNTIEQAKAAQRQQAHAARAALPSETRVAASHAIAEHFFSTIAPEPGLAVAAYWRIRDEVDCEPILVRLMDGGHKVLLPVVTGPEKPLDFRVWENGAQLFEAGFGTLAPSELAPRATPDVVLVPLLGFDRAGTRLGYGGGYYDRTLAEMASKPQLVGLAFSAQEIAAIPREPHDLPLDAVVTETGVRFFGSAAA